MTNSEPSGDNLQDNLYDAEKHVQEARSVEQSYTNIC